MYMYIHRIILLHVHVTCQHNFYEKPSLVYMYVLPLHLVYVHVHVCSSGSQSFAYPDEHEDVTPLSSDR